MGASKKFDNGVCVCVCVCVFVCVFVCVCGGGGLGGWGVGGVGGGLEKFSCKWWGKT